ncbi:hypothetical protein [Candidatus Sarmatiella mevalonica]|uniref:hypothetical protein n=1 Tax=Candidatus Sarmatiella mevalonica TaxID=2770581 RepID=UPI0019223D4D|nr:hypothetical protein [Candidatus Sarmatiella mevalonica]
MTKILHDLSSNFSVIKSSFDIIQSGANHQSTKPAELLESSISTFFYKITAFNHLVSPAIEYNKSATREINEIVIHYLRLSIEHATVYVDCQIHEIPETLKRILIGLALHISSTRPTSALICISFFTNRKRNIYKIRLEVKAQSFKFHESKYQTMMQQVTQETITLYNVLEHFILQLCDIEDISLIFANYGSLLIYEIQKYADFDCDM